MILINQDGIIYDVNPKIAEILEIEKESIINREYSDFIPTPDIEERKRKRKLVFEEKISGYQIERDFITADGKKIHTLLSNSLIKQNGEKLLLSVVDDITEKKY